MARRSTWYPGVTRADLERLRPLHAEAMALARRHRPGSPQFHALAAVASACCAAAEACGERHMFTSRDTFDDP